ncbi:ABC transporter substrate-binding protein [Bacillus solimangrovi]|uniref:Fe/B12 periplasmic-binding domain-containing protein n=1 Tax=Bacillus solimangrovi TaxID=1305675 RepID=A0A1E5LCD4_9BACI|nr:Fe(3+) dicitrate ABC transporter substrate-binding protein [Bacillus solimangrovi]OEH91750.1 hypothetical protein BFG57_17760 [Bacillus solimangrovi]
MLSYSKKTYALFFAAIIFVVSALVGCSSQPTEVVKDEVDVEDDQTGTGSTEIVIEHELGTTTIPEQPEKIIALEFSFVDALASLDITPVGIADDGDEARIIAPILEKINDYTSVGTRKQPSLEVISSLQPDLIIADLKRHKEIYEDLQKIAPTIILPSLAGGYDENLASFPIIAQAVGKSEIAEQRLAEHNEIIEAVKAKVPADESRTVLPAVVTNDSFHGHSSDAYTGSLLQKLGFANAIVEEKAGDLQEYLGAPYLKMSLEQLVEFNPDILFLMKSGDKTVVEEWAENPLWNSISAVKNGAVYEVDRDTWSRFRGLISSEIIAQDSLNFLYGQTIE